MNLVYRICSESIYRNPLRYCKDIKWLRPSLKPRLLMEPTTGDSLYGLPDGLHVHRRHADGVLSEAV